jgi:hypothetical protein
VDIEIKAGSKKLLIGGKRKAVAADKAQRQQLADGIDEECEQKHDQRCDHEQLFDP